MSECEICGSFVKNIKIHQKTQKCMKIRNQKELKCKGCGVSFSSKMYLCNHHYKNCIQYQLLLKDEFYQKQLEIKNQEILELKNLIKDLKKQSVSNINSNNNNTNNNINIQLIYKDPEDLLKDNLKDHHLIRGLSGLTDCLAEKNMINDENGKTCKIFKCLDASRGKFCFKDSNDNVIEDYGKKLAKLIQKQVSEKSEKAIQEIYKKKEKIKENDIKNIDNLQKMKNIDYEYERFGKKLAKKIL